MTGDVTVGSRPWLKERVKDRHPGTVHLMLLFAWAHLPPNLEQISRLCADLALTMVERLHDGPELTTALRKLREARDCFVTQAVIDQDMP